MQETYYIGLDLGQRADYTAITVVHRAERTEPPEIGAEQAMHLRYAGRSVPYSKTEPRRIPSILNWLTANVVCV